MYEGSAAQTCTTPDVGLSDVHGAQQREFTGIVLHFEKSQVTYQGQHSM
jgi:hypothetical protein